MTPEELDEIVARANRMDPYSPDIMGFGGLEECFEAVCAALREAWAGLELYDQMHAKLARAVRVVEAARYAEDILQSSPETRFGRVQEHLHKALAAYDTEGGK